MPPCAIPFIAALAPLDGVSTDVVAHRFTHIQRDAPLVAAAPAVWTFVDIAISPEGRAHADAVTVDDIDAVREQAIRERALPERTIPVLAHAGPMAGAFLVDRPVAVSDVVTVFGRRPHALDDDAWHATIARYVAARDRLVAHGAPAVLLSVDESGLLASALSPRANPLESESARIARVTSIVRALAAGPVPVGVALTVEERFPGGIDARLGIDTARACVDAGAAFFLAGRDTGDIDRDAPARVDTGDPVLASAAWLVGRVGVPVFALGPSLDVARTAARARAFALAGFVCLVEKGPALEGLT